MLENYRLEKDQWQGLIYDPESGNTYQSRMRINDEGRLEIRGYIGIPMFGRTAEFEPASSCREHIVRMLQATTHQDIC